MKLPEIDGASLDPCIRHTVLYLRSLGFDTTDSGDGLSKRGMEGCLDYPHVAIVTTPRKMFRESFRLKAALGEPWQVEASFSPNDGKCILFASKPLDFNPDTMAQDGLIVDVPVERSADGL